MVLSSSSGSGSSGSGGHGLAQLGWDDGWAAAASGPAFDARPGRVVRVDKGVCSVRTEHTVHRVGLSGDLLSSTCQDPVAAPCVGDWVMLRSWSDGRETLERVLPRRSALVRGQAGGASPGQALAANIDLVAVVVGLDQVPSESRLERFLTLAWGSGAAPAVILTKADLAADAYDIAEDVDGLSSGGATLVCSTVDGRGMTELRALVGHGTAALLGSSGSGKSALVNGLIGDDVLRTRAIRSDGRGRHTSVRRELVLLPGGGCVIDTPGVRSAGLVAENDGLAATFADVEEIAAECRFGDCSHEQEPGCAVRTALESGRLSQRRYESWRKLCREAAYTTRRIDTRERDAERTRSKKHRSVGRDDPSR